jgi:hypothetical protein
MLRRLLALLLLVAAGCGQPAVGHLSRVSTQEFEVVAIHGGTRVREVCLRNVRTAQDHRVPLHNYADPQGRLAVGQRVRLTEGVGGHEHAELDADEVREALDRLVK